MTVKITLACTECKQRNYNTTKNKKNNPDRLEMKKYCRFARSTPFIAKPSKRKAEHNGRQNREKAGLCGQS